MQRDTLWGPQPGHAGDWRCHAVCACNKDEKPKLAGGHDQVPWKLHSNDRTHANHSSSVHRNCRSGGSVVCRSSLRCDRAHALGHLGCVSLRLELILNCCCWSRRSRPQVLMCACLIRSVDVVCSPELVDKRKKPWRWSRGVQIGVAYCLTR